MLPRAVALLLVGVVGGAVLTGSPSAPARVVWYRPRTVVVLADRADSGGADGGDDGGVVCRSWAGVRRTDSGDADGGWRLLTAVSMPWQTSRWSRYWWRCRAAADELVAEVLGGPNVEADGDGVAVAVDGRGADGDVVPQQTSRSKSTASVDDVAITTIAQVVTATGRDAR